MIILDPIPVTDAVLISTNVPAENPPYSTTAVYGPGELVNVDSANVHDVYQQVLGTTATVTLTIASPCIVALTANGFANGQPVKLTTTGALPTGLTAGTTYFVVSVATHTFSLAATVGGAAINTTGTQSGVHTLTANTIGNPITDATHWLRKGVRNAYKMFDAINNTLTENPEVITVSLKVSAIAGGVYLGGVTSDEIYIESVDPIAGTVHTRTESMLEPTSGSSYWGWTFNRIRRRNYFLDLDLPMYYDATVTISIRKPGGIAKCGMCAIGPLTDVGFSLYGMGLEDRDYSSTRFESDGTSTTVVRGYSKILTLDVSIYNDQIGAITNILRDFRQRNVVYIGAVEFGHSVVFGTYESLKSVMPNVAFSIMAFKVNGVI